eukprot:scaffold1143_cov214-Chaetoceros_neogracile.AAC.6
MVSCRNFTVNVLMVLPLAILSIVFAASANAEKIVPKVGDAICIEGYIMDLYCIALGKLFDNKDIPTLSAIGPIEHSVHCLIDVPHCIASPFEVLIEQDDGSFGRACKFVSFPSNLSNSLKLGKRLILLSAINSPILGRIADKEPIVEYAKEFAVCKNCEVKALDKDLFPSHDATGLRLTLKAEVVKSSSSRTPTTIAIKSVHEFEEFDTVCGGKVYVPPRIITSSGILSRQITAHGVLMIIGWGLLLPTGAIISKFGKHRPNDLWFKIHRVIQPLGLLLALIAWGIALKNFRALDAKGDGSLYYTHAVMGMTTMILGIIQPINAIFRPSAAEDGKEKTKLRLIWEICHKGLGWFAVALALATIGVGTTLLREPRARNFKRARNFQIVYGVAVGGCLVILTSFLLIEKDKYKNVPANEEEAEVKEDKEVGSQKEEREI